MIKFSNYNAQIIKYPLITEKATQLVENNQYSFIVNRSADKITIKNVIENLFKVKVIKINTSHLPLKKKRVGKFIGYKPKYKKAIVKLSKDDVINLYTNS